jgi:predicted HTH transcriptional regulator
MLFSKPISDLTHADIEEFCQRFREGLRVEYKSSFDASVKNKLSRVVSSFANSYGGILIVGVNSDGGIPVEPFDGIEFEDREPRLTVENICRSDIFPEVFVYQNLVPSRVSGKAFLVVQVNESPRAPHALQNSTRVYRRTGDSADPTTLADLAMIERLLVRRRDVSARWDGFFTESDSCLKR